MKILEEEGAVLALVPCGENPTNQKTKRKTKLPQSIIVPKDIQHCKPDTLKTAFHIKHALGDDGGFRLSQSLDTQQRREFEIIGVKKWMQTVLSIQHRELREE